MIYNLNTLVKAIEVYNSSIQNYTRLNWLSLNGIPVNNNGYTDMKDNERIMRQIADSIGIQLVEVSDYFSFFEPRLDPEHDIYLEYYKIEWI